VVSGQWSIGIVLGIGVVPIKQRTTDNGQRTNAKRRH
jgi:hypothetical protein